MEIVGNYAYVGAYSGNAIQVIDITDSLNPTGVTHITTATGSYQIDGVNGLTYSNGYIYASATTSNAITVIDAREPTVPVFVSSIKHSVSNPLLSGVKNCVKI